VIGMDGIELNSPSVQSYLTNLQAVINRIASNSAACKTWCVGLVSAVIIVIASTKRPCYIGVSIIPIGLLSLLDSYYLGLEKEFRALYNEFIAKLHSGAATAQDVFVIEPGPGGCKRLSSTIKAFGSVSIWPFYGLLVLMLIAMWSWVL